MGGMVAKLSQRTATALPTTGRARRQRLKSDLKRNHLSGERLHGAKSARSTAPYRQESSEPPQREAPSEWFVTKPCLPCSLHKPRTHEPSPPSHLPKLATTSLMIEVEALVSNIGFPVVSRESDPDVPRHVGMGDFGKPLPAVDALIKIGEPCLIRIIKKIGEADHVTEHKACLRVLLALQGRETTEAMMKDALEKETDARKRTRRKNSLIMLSQMK
jgi:hypothetical protein